jgi:hypothetical protein
MVELVAGESEVPRRAKRCGLGVGIANFAGRPRLAVVY